MMHLRIDVKEKLKFSSSIGFKNIELTFEKQ